LELSDEPIQDIETGKAKIKENSNTALITHNILDINPIAVVVLKTKTKAKSSAICC
jgi:hypothetical protein